MKIAIITELFHPHVAGSEKRFFEIGRRLVKHGHEVHVFTIQHKKDLKKRTMLRVSKFIDTPIPRII